MKTDVARKNVAGKPRRNGIPAFNRFIDAMRATWSESMKDEQRWKQVGRLLTKLLTDKKLREAARAWPPSHEGKGRYSNLLFYEDPDYKFAVNGLVKAAGAATPVHDHGDSWTVYGVLHGTERIVHYARPHSSKGVHIKIVGEFDAACGFVDVVPPGRFHAEIAGDEPTIAIIVRSRRVGRFLQNNYDPATGRVIRRRGPAQRSYQLS